MKPIPRAPQYYPTADPAQLTALVEQDYALGRVLHCALIRTKDNDNFLVETEQDRYVLRVYRFRKHWLQQESDYLFELTWLTYLHEQVLPMAYPIPRRDGSFLGTLDAVEGPRHWALFSYADGEPGLTPTQAWRFGESIAQIHLASNAFRPTYPRFHADLSWLLDQSVARLHAFLDETERHIVDHVTALAEPLGAAIRSFPFAGDDYGIIGGDFHGDNHHFDRQNRITHFDSDLCSYGWRAYDLAVFRSVRGRSNQLWEQALAGYQSVRPLATYELEAIPTFVLIRHIWVMGSVTTYPEAVTLRAAGLWARWYEALLDYESGSYLTE